MEITDIELVESILNSYIDNTCLNIEQEYVQSKFETISTELAGLDLNFNQNKETNEVLIEKKINQVNEKVINLESELEVFFFSFI